MEIVLKIDRKSQEQINELLKCPERVAAAYEAASEMAACTLANTLRRGIENQRFKFAPLAASTLARKTDKRTLIETHKYVRSFRAMKRGRGWGVAMDARLSRLHEGGTSRMPARPHMAQGVAALQANRRAINAIAEVFRDTLLGVKSTKLEKSR